jgi:fumigallin biosynthesis monooxygenase-like protein
LSSDDARVVATINRRATARIEGPFVVFLIGARINRWWKMPLHLWFGGTMPRMIRELEAHPESGFLGHQPLSFTTMVQYWRTLDQLVAYARSQDQTHYPYWVKFNRRIASNGDIGIWHETYLVNAGQYEVVYNNMPRFGLGKVSDHLDAIGERATALGRLGRSDGSDAPITPDGEEASVSRAGSAR